MSRPKISERSPSRTLAGAGACLANGGALAALTISTAGEERAHLVEAQASEALTKIAERIERMTKTLAPGAA